MTMLKPTLYTQAGTADVPDRPSRRGGRCDCGYVFFPMQVYGCERCGRHGAALAPMLLGGRGWLLFSTVVRLHPDPLRPVPFTIGKILLDDGPVIRTLLADPETDVTPGTTMVATLVPVGDGDDGLDILDLRFAPAH